MGSQTIGAQALTPSPRRRLAASAAWLPVIVTAVALLAPTAPALAARDSPARLVPGPTAAVSYTATPISDRTNVYRKPGGGGRPLMRLRTGSPPTGNPDDILGDGLLVLGSRADSRGHVWLRVQLLQHPLGRSGWIDSKLAELTPNPYRVEIRLRARRLVVYRSGRVVKRARVVIGAPTTPTPRGLFAIARQIDCTQFSCASGFVGSAINLLTAYSPAFQASGFAGGEAIVAIHGRGRSALADPIGSARSHGCVRVRNVTATWILRTLTPGTPVRIAR